MTFVDPLFDFIFSPFLPLPIFWAILGVSFILALLVVLVYKYTTNQERLRELQAQLKQHQKELRENKDPSRLAELQKKTTDTSLQHLRMTIKPTLITMLPLLLIFGWFSGHFAYAPLLPNQEFNLSVETYANNTAEVTITAQSALEVSAKKSGATPETSLFTLIGPKGEYFLQIHVGNKTYEKQLIITTRNTYAEPISVIQDGFVEKIYTSQQEPVVINLFGWEIGWIGSYIIFSLVFNTLLRKMFKLV